LKKKKTKITPLDLIVSALILAAAVYLGYRIRVGLHYKWNWQAIPQYLYRYDQESGKWVANLIMQGLFTTLRLSSGQIMPVLGLNEFILAQSETTQRLCELLFAPPSFLSAFFSALITLAIFEGAYIAEIVRAGIQSIDKGQWEAAHALGLSKWQQMRYIILPQAVQRILPPLAGQFISLIKDSSIVSVISIQELTFQGMELMATTYLTFEIWITITLLYLVMTFTCSLAVQRLEVRMARGRA
jgi:polar amino acid transport system permease protein